MIWKVYIPSYKRSDKIKTHKLFNKENVVIVIGEDEREEYEKFLGSGYNYLLIPKERNTNIAKARNFMLENADTECILMMDDDVESVGYYEKGKKCYLNVEELENFVADGFRMAKELGVHLWGINMTADRMAYREFTPFSFSVPILGTFCGIIKTDIKYMEEIYLKEDYDFFLEHIHKDHKTLRFNKYHYNTIHLTIPGGCAAYRTMGEEKRQAEILQKKWGSKVVKLKNTTNPTIISPYKGV